MKSCKFLSVCLVIFAVAEKNLREKNQNLLDSKLRIIMIKKTVNSEMFLICNCEINVQK